MALIDLGLRARSYTGSHVKILTDNAYTRAHRWCSVQGHDPWTLTALR